MDYVCTDRPVELAANHAADVIKQHLSKNEKVLWLLTGGSGIRIATLASKKLVDVDLTNLFVTLTDERFGPVGHQDENWQQLLDGGLSLPIATLYRPLINSDMETTSRQFGNWLDDKYKKVDFVLGLFGIGADGHTAGIKPHSPSINAQGSAVSYRGDDFNRVTITLKSIRRIDEAILQASGNEKSLVLHQLIYEKIPLIDQPAQILKEIPKLTIYSNNPKEK